MPRFKAEDFERNLSLLAPYEALARQAGGTPAQLALAWLLARGEDIVPIPGTTRIAHLEENVAAQALRLDPDLIRRLDALINEKTVAGDRYNAATQREIDTETFRLDTQEEHHD
jgi:hypothetical protein